ncbi:MAG: shikimate dehydrogenase [Candidatus Methanofastidiosa archaeon]|nr:shikimate dehydrogenase [Candidatus Methanofastidiosa archaeon]
MSLFIVAGSPVSHSLSPAMHNAAFKALGMDDHHYGAVQVGIGDVDSVVSMLRSGRIAGANVTYPLKTVMASRVDALEGVAREIESVNTLVPHAGTVSGLSTDGDGCVRALESRGVSLEDASILLIGAGGAARSIAVSLAHARPRSITVANRTLEHARHLARRLEDMAPAAGVALDALTDHASKADVIIQATSVGMRHHVAELPLADASLAHRPTVMDIVYDPLETPLLSQARKAGCPIVDGIDLLVWQGALSFQAWLGVVPPVDAMQKAARAAGGRP